VVAAIPIGVMPTVADHRWDTLCYSLVIVVVVHVAQLMIGMVTDTKHSGGVLLLAPQTSPSKSGVVVDLVDGLSAVSRVTLVVLVLMPSKLFVLAAILRLEILGQVEPLVECVGKCSLPQQHRIKAPAVKDIKDVSPTLQVVV